MSVEITSNLAQVPYLRNCVTLGQLNLGLFIKSTLANQEFPQFYTLLCIHFILNRWMGQQKQKILIQHFNNSMETTTLRHMFFQRKPRDAEPIRVEILHFGSYNFDVIRFLTSCALAQWYVGLFFATCNIIFQVSSAGHFVRPQDNCFHFFSPTFLPFLLTHPKLSTVCTLQFFLRRRLLMLL